MYLIGYPDRYVDRCIGRYIDRYWIDTRPIRRSTVDRESTDVFVEILMSVEVAIVTARALIWLLYKPKSYLPFSLVQLMKTYPFIYLCAV